MKHITEIIPDDIPEWMQDAIDAGQFFRLCKEKAENQQAKIDALMLEYCEDEMTVEQVANWMKHQVTPPEKN